jgi:hypothetical protein
MKSKTRQRLDVALTLVDKRGGVSKLDENEFKELGEACKAFEAERKDDAARAGGTEPDTEAKQGPVPSAEDAARERMIARHRAAWKEPPTEVFKDNVKPPDPSGFPAMPSPPATKQDSVDPRAARRDEWIAAIERIYQGDMDQTRADWRERGMDYLEELHTRAQAYAAEQRIDTSTPEPLDHSKDPARRRMLANNKRLSREG